MKIEDYINEGHRLKALGNSTDGCSFVGWLLNEKYTPACWAHDFGRQNLIVELEDQSENDNHFRSALRHLGMSKLGSNLMYYFTKTQGFTKDKLGIDAVAFALILGAIILLPVLIYFQPYFNQ